MLEKFKNDMAVFSFKQHQDVLTYLHQLEISGWSISDAKEWVEDSKKKKTTNVVTQKISFKCPNCQSPMRLLSVNTNSANQTDDNSKSVWFCTNRTCMNTIYNTESVEEITSKRKNNKNV